MIGGANVNTAGLDTGIALTSTGSKLYFAIDESLRSGHPFLDLLLSRAGITWYGGLIGGTLLVTLATHFHGLSTRVVASCVATAAPFGQACGRIGCFLVGDDYGRPTDLPWGIAFPLGAPPTDGVDLLAGEIPPPPGDDGGAGLVARSFNS